MSESAGDFAIGDSLSLADCFLVPQVRNALLAGIDLAAEFPVLNRVWKNAIQDTAVRSVIDDAGGVIQPLAFDAEKFEVYAGGIATTPGKEVL